MVNIKTKKRSQWSTSLKVEKDFEELFISCAKRQKGYAFKIKMSSINGLPDLCCVMPGFVPVLLEAKLIKDVGSTFKRTINYSKLQTELLSKCNKVNPVHTVAWGLVFVKYCDGYDYCALMEPEIPTMTHNDILSRTIGVVAIEGGGLNILKLFDGMVPKLHTQADHENVISLEEQSMLLDNSKEK